MHNRNTGSPLSDKTKNTSSIEWSGVVQRNWILFIVLVEVNWCCK